MRYAVYFAPDAESALWRFGCSILGYDARSGEDVAHPKLQIADLHKLTEEPRRYGFHATLKAPFELADGIDEEALVEAAERFARSQSAFVLPKLEAVAIGRFIALVPATPSPEINRLADAAVESFEPFRAPLDEADIVRRVPARLTERQRDYLMRYGYPFVLEEFRFHMTLTGTLPQPDVQPLLRALGGLYALVAQPLPIDAICLFRQEDRQARFRLWRRFPFG